MSNYYISKPDGTQEGPYDKTTLISLVKNHTYSPDSYIWCEGMAEWKPFREVFKAKKKAPRPASPAPMTAHPIQKKKMKGLMIGIIAGALLATGGVTYWLSEDNEAKQNKVEKEIEEKISSDEELYNLFERNFQTYLAGNTSELKEVILVEFTDEKYQGMPRFQHVRDYILVLNHGEAAKYLIKNMMKNDEDKEEFLEDAIQCGAHNVAIALIESGVTITDEQDKEHLLRELVQNAARMHKSTEPKRLTRSCLPIKEKYIESRDFRKCAELAVEKFNSPVLKEDVHDDVKQLKLMGKEKPLTDYISSKM